MMEEAMRRRKIARGHLTRITRGMEEALNNPDTTLDDLEDLIEEFNTKLLIAEACQDEVLNHHDPDGEDFETALTEVRTYILPRRTIRRKDSIMKKELQDNIYVDNLLSGADSEKEALEKYEEACKMLSSAGMLLNKWTSNNRSVKVRFELGQVLSEEHKVLGIRWDSYDDALGFEGVYSQITTFASTKRGLLSSVGRIFDPLGLISPFTLQAKMLFQQCWRLGLQWDEELPADLSCEYQNWLKSSQDLSELRFPRAYFPNQPW
ncbi:unnamed protein product, partial [Meganyctiphanes norvegica]